MKIREGQRTEGGGLRAEDGQKTEGGRRWAVVGGLSAVYRKPDDRRRRTVVGEEGRVVD